MLLEQLTKEVKPMKKHLEIKRNQKMNVKALIAELRKYDENLLVVVDGYEGGITEKFNLLQVNMDTNVNKAWYYGESEVSDSKDAVPALYLQRERLNRN